jgi:hypothetical protein
MFPHNLPQHGYEEIREVVFEILLGQAGLSTPVSQFGDLLAATATVFHTKEPSTYAAAHAGYSTQVRRLHPSDEKLVRDVFWDLFRQGLVTLGMNSSNPNWPFFRLSHFGSASIQSRLPFRFHDQSSYLALVRREIPDITDQALVYLQEAVAAFYAECLLSACVMLGVAAEAEFLRLIDVACSSRSKFPNVFTTAVKATFIGTKVKKFRSSLLPIVGTLQPSDRFQNVESNLALIMTLFASRGMTLDTRTPLPPLRANRFTCSFSCSCIMPARLCGSERHWRGPERSGGATTPPPAPAAAGR